MEETGGGGGGQNGPVGRARVRWKEAQNEMPEVEDSPACLRFVICGGMLASPCMGVRVKKVLQETQGAASGRRSPTGGSRRLWGASELKGPAACAGSVGKDTVGLGPAAGEEAAHHHHRGEPTAHSHARLVCPDLPVRGDGCKGASGSSCVRALCLCRPSGASGYRPSWRSWPPREDCWPARWGHLHDLRGTQWATLRSASEFLCPEWPWDHHG